MNRTCQVENCNAKHRAKGYCQRHYAQMLRHGEITDYKRDLLGKSFGKLKVHSKSRSKNKYGHTLWNCVCACGEETQATTGDLRSVKGVKSCGCLHSDVIKKRNAEAAKDMYNKKYGRLTALFPTERRNSSCQILWSCICACGNSALVSASSLRSGKTKSCGCLAEENLKSDEHRSRINAGHRRRRLPKGVAAVNSIALQYKKNACKRNIEWGISDEEFHKLILSDCFYCGAPPENKKKMATYSENYLYTGVDRVDNKMGYVKNNVVPCCKRCNLAKNIMSLRDFTSWIMRVYTHMLPMCAPGYVEAYMADRA